jgi:hypothetical protein
VKGWRGPEYEGEYPTLGYAVLEWMHAHLPSPADDTQPFDPTDEQYRLVLAWYRLDPQSGRFLERRGSLEMAKGWGKSPLVAALALCEFAGPALFDGWDAHGDPVARPWGLGDDPAPWVQVAANSEDQSENTYGAIYAYLTARDGKVADAIGVDQGRTRLYLKANPGAKLEPVTASAGSREGQRVTFAVLDETHLWTRRSGGLKLANTLRRNVAKMNGRTLETTNAPILGERSVAEETGIAAEDSEPGVFLYARRPTKEPMEDWSDDQLMAELRHVYGDARWIDLDRILREVHDPATEWSDALRFYFNTRTTGAGRAVDPRVWDDLRRDTEVPTGAHIGLGFDGSISQDATVLVGCTLEGHGFLIRAWVRPHDAPPDWRVDRKDVRQTIDDTFAKYNVGLMLCDPPKWYTEIEDWIVAFGEDRVVMLDTNQPRRFAPATDRWLTAIREGAHTNDGDRLIRDHVLAAQLRKVRINDSDDDGRTHYVLIKGEDGRRIDGAVADVLAYQAAQTMPPLEDNRVEFFLL